MVILIQMVMVVDLVPVWEDTDDIYNIKVKLILYPKYLCLKVDIIIEKD